jgi:hypothetical protein
MCRDLGEGRLQLRQKAVVVLHIEEVVLTDQAGQLVFDNYRQVGNMEICHQIQCL